MHRYDVLQNTSNLEQNHYALSNLCYFKAGFLVLYRLSSNLLLPILLVPEFGLILGVKTCETHE